MQARHISLSVSGWLNQYRNWPSVIVRLARSTARRQQPEPPNSNSEFNRERIFVMICAAAALIDDETRLDRHRLFRQRRKKHISCYFVMAIGRRAHT
jgi:hypothetical protein